jgi:hypothetical protein
MKNNDKDNLTPESGEIGAEYHVKKPRGGKGGDATEPSTPTPKSGVDSYYELKTDAVDLLVNTEERIERGEINLTAPEKFKGSAFSKIPNWIRAIFIKFWFNGAVCFFIIWGLSEFIPHPLDLAVVTGIVLGLITDIMVNPSIRFMTDEKGGDAWMLLPMKKFWTFPLNIVYAAAVMLVVELIYVALNIPGIEPFSFAAIYLVVDLTVVGLKDLIVLLVKKLRHK